jgi:hypothetical protein
MSGVFSCLAGVDLVYGTTYWYDPGVVHSFIVLDILCLSTGTVQIPVSYRTVQVE